MSTQYKVLNLAQVKHLLAVDEITCDRLQFHEKLFVFNHEGKKIGRCSINVEPEIDETRGQLLVVHISNKANLSGVESLTTTTGAVTHNLKTVEEIRHEYCGLPNGKQERRMYLLRERTKYYCSITSSVCGIDLKQHITIPFVKSIGLIGEASNVLILRTIAIRGFEGILSLSTILSNGKRCRNYYISKLCQKNVNGLSMQVMTIYRTITNHKNYNLTTISVLTRSGQMIYLFWSNTKYFLHLDPELEVAGPLINGERRVGLHRHWNRDIQIYSLYLDRKVKQKAIYNSYVTDRTELKRIVADFIQSVLLLKPPDILDFAVRYFIAFDRFPQQESSQESELGESYSFE